LGFLSERLPATPEYRKRFVRQGDPDFQAFHHGLCRAVGRGRWWIMEQQPGPANWAPSNPDPLPGMARLWAMEAFAHGAEAVCYFRWRQASFAQEQMHAGLVRPDSIAAPAYDEAAIMAGDLAQMPEVSTAHADVGLVFDYASAWAWETQPQGRDFSCFRLVFETYRSLRRLGPNIDILPPDTADLSGYRLVLAPGTATLSESFLAAQATYQGIALIGPRSSAKADQFASPVPLPPNLPRLAATVARVQSLPPDVPVPLALGGNFLHWREKVETTATVAESSQDGWPALIRSGGMHCLAGWPDEAAFARILTALCHQAGIKTDLLPER
jgi:beta-galactosidase